MKGLLRYSVTAMMFMACASVSVHAQEREDDDMDGQSYIERHPVLTVGAVGLAVGSVIATRHAIKSGKVAAIPEQIKDVKAASERAGKRALSAVKSVSSKLTKGAKDVGSAVAADAAFAKEVVEEQVAKVAEAVTPDSAAPERTPAAAATETADAPGSNVVVWDPYAAALIDLDLVPSREVGIDSDELVKYDGSIVRRDFVPDDAMISEYTVGEGVTERYLVIQNPKDTFKTVMKIGEESQKAIRLVPSHKTMFPAHTFTKELLKVLKPTLK